MTKRNIPFAPVLGALLACGLAFSGTAPAAEDPAAERIRNSLAVLLPTIAPDSVRATPVPGLYEVAFGPRLVYVSEDGRFLVQGSIVDLEKRENITEPRLADIKRATLEAVGEENMLSFGPADARYTISVFTDIDCGYCRKLHEEVGAFNEAGIRVRYLFYPRAGQGSPSYAKAVSSWCADDPKKTFTEAKQGKEIPAKSCDNPVDEHLELGRQFGVQGTPTIILDDGESLPGYVPAGRLKQLLESRQTAAAK
jgi:thiol:disulfide interchange protein DsbC